MGTVSDLAGARVGGAKVTITNTATNADLVVESNGEGNYSANNLQIGVYRISAEKAGFKVAVENRVDISVNQVTKLDFALSPGSETQTVEVSAAATQLQTQSSSLGTVETTQRISELPLNGRNFIALAYLGPGANSGQTGANAAGGVFENERASNAISVNGLRVTNNNFLLNGIDNNEFGNGGVIILPPPDAIQEFRTEESAMSAEFGRGGAAVNVVVKSGTNQMHGGAYEFIRNDQLDAAELFLYRQNPVPAQPVWRVLRLSYCQEPHLRVFGLRRHPPAARRSLCFLRAHSDSERSGDFHRPAYRANLLSLALREGHPSTPARCSIPIALPAITAPAAKRFRCATR